MDLWKEGDLRNNDKERRHTLDDREKSQVDYRPQVATLTLCINALSMAPAHGEPDRYYCFKYDEWTEEGLRGCREDPKCKVHSHGWEDHHASASCALIDSARAPRRARESGGGGGRRDEFPTHPDRRRRRRWTWASALDLKHQA